MEWKNIMNVHDVNIDVRDPVACAPHYQSGRSQPTSETMGARKMSFCIRVIPPGKFAIPYHFHHHVEELFLILEGEATLRQHDHRRIVKQGDLLFFPTGPEGAHQLYNHSDKPVKYLDLTTTSERDICEYPDTDKMLVQEVGCFQKKDKVDYWKGEESPSPFWHE